MKNTKARSRIRRRKKKTPKTKAERFSIVPFHRKKKLLSFLRPQQTQPPQSWLVHKIKNTQNSALQARVHCQKLSAELRKLRGFLSFSTYLYCTLILHRYIYIIFFSHAVQCVFFRDIYKIIECRLVTVVVYAIFLSLRRNVDVENKKLAPRTKFGLLEFSDRE